MSRRSIIARLAVVMSVLAAPVASAAEPDPEAGKTKAYTCLGCHGTVVAGQANAYPTYRVPKLWGQHAVYLETALKAYRAGEREHSTMKGNAATLSDQDIADIAAYFANGAEIEEAPVRGTAPESAQPCVACHTDSGRSTTPTFPILAGQWQDYLAHTLEQYRSGERENSLMNGQAQNLSDEDIAALAEFYAKQAGLTYPEE